MRIETTTLPQAAREHSRKLNNTSAFPGVPAEQANDVATTKRAEAANIAASGKPAEKPDDAGAAQLTPAGLLAAQAHFEAMNPSEMNRGQSQALESITRNIARYQSNHPAPTSSPAGAADTGATAGEQSPSVDISV